MVGDHRHVHFVGTIGFDTVDEVLGEVGQRLAPFLTRVPDGEVAGRRLWISYQIPVLRSYGFLKPVPPNMFVPLDLADDFEPEQAHFAELGYAREARVSYEDFCQARDAGKIPPGVRFQVSMPTPFGVIGVFMTPRAVAALENAYTEAMLREMAAICDHIPHEDLAFQWDVCREMSEWDAGGNADGMLGDDGHAGIVARMKRLSDPIPLGVRHGYHFCYGNFDGGDVELPRDPKAMISLYHALCEAVERPIDWVHMPVPGHAGEAFFADFSELHLRPETELFVGVVHDAEETAALRERVLLAQRHVPSFGVAARCGIARGRSSEAVRSLLDAHAIAATA